MAKEAKNLGKSWNKPWTMVHGMKVNGYHLLQRKQNSLVNPNALEESPKMTMFIHFRSIDRAVERSENPEAPLLLGGFNLTPTAPPGTTPLIEERRTYSVIETLNEGEEVLNQVIETHMTQEEVEKFEEDWKNLWNPEDQKLVISHLNEKENL
jgi:hypothetical protein